MFKPILLTLLLSALRLQSQNDSNVLITFSDPVNHLYGFKTISGRIILPPTYMYIESDTLRSYTIVEDVSGEFFWIDSTLKTLFKFYQTDGGIIDFFCNGLVRIRENKKVGFADSAGHRVIPAIYDYVTPFYGKVAAFYSGGEYICLDPGVPDSRCEHFGWSNGSWGILNKNNDTLIPPPLDAKDLNLESITEINPHSELFTSIKARNKLYYIENIQKSFKAFFTSFINEAKKGKFPVDSFGINLRAIFSDTLIAYLEDSTKTLTTILLLPNDDGPLSVSYEYSDIPSISEFMGHLDKNRYYYEIWVSVNRIGKDSKNFQENFHFLYQSINNIRLIRYFKTD